MYVWCMKHPPPPETKTCETLETKSVKRELETKSANAHWKLKCESADAHWTLRVRKAH